MKDNEILILQIAISFIAALVYSLIMKKLRKNEVHAVYERKIKSVWSKKVIIASIVNAILLCFPLVFFDLYDAGLISMASLVCFSIVFFIAAFFMFFGVLIPLLRKWSVGTIRMGEEYIEIFDTKHNKRTNFQWSEIEWITVLETEESIVRIYVDNRLIELKGVSSPQDVLEMFHQKCPTKYSPEIGLR